MSTTSRNSDRPARRRLSVAQRSETILAAAAQLFGAASYDSVSMSNIAKASQSSEALVFHYFGSKAELYAKLVENAVTELESNQDAAQAALAQGVPVRDRVRATIEVYLDFVASQPVSWAFPLRGGAEPAQARQVRDEAREAYVRRLRELLGVRSWMRHDYAVAGFFGFLDQACLRWVDRDCPPDERESIIAATLGALEGALGDWQV